MHTHTSLLSFSLVAVVALGCGPRSLPQRSSPALEPTGASPILDGLSALDQRRDGVFAVHTGDEAIVQRMADGTLTELFRLEGTPSMLVSRADDDVLVGTYDAILRWDGAGLVDLTPRLEAALILAHPFAGLAVGAIDLAADGTIVVAVTVQGQGGEAPYGQLCTLPAAGADACEALDAINGDEYADARGVLVEGTRTYLLIEADDRLYVREGAGAFSLVTPDRVVFLMSIEGGGVGYVRDGGTSSALHVLDANGQEARRVEGVWFATGHSAAGLWEHTFDSEGDGSCGASWSTCHEPILWTQLTAFHIGEARVEVAHLDNVSEPLVLPLADGSLRMEVDGQVYELASR